MAGTQRLRELVNERLAVAAEQIFRLVEKTIVEYQEEVVRSKKEVIQLKKHLEQLSLLKAEVILNRTDANSDTEDILPSQQSDQLPSVEENEAQCSQHIKDELVDVSVCPHPKADASRDGKDGYESETSHSTDSQQFDALRVTLNDRWTGAEWNLVNCGQSPIQAISMEREQTFLEQRMCRFCGQIFSRDCDLIRHMDEIHMGERAFKCSSCDKEFARRNHLAIHLRIHTGERPHTCPFCKKSFAQRSNLNVHLRTHTGEKPYFCKTCGK
ncbi:unnamed protein product, partial [Tetraodon nigroviridis]